MICVLRSDETNEYFVRREGNKDITTTEPAAAYMYEVYWDVDEFCVKTVDGKGRKPHRKGNWRPVPIMIVTPQERKS